MSHSALTSEMELHDMEGQEAQSQSEALSHHIPTAPVPNHDHLTNRPPVVHTDAENPAPLKYSTHNSPLLPKGAPVAPEPASISNNEVDYEPRKIALDGRRMMAFWRCFIHFVPLGITIGIIFLNASHVYWQDLGRPNQSTILQAWQYAAKAHELLIVASLSSIALYRIQYRMITSKGVPLGYVTAAYQLAEPNFLFGKEFLGGITTRTQLKGLSTTFPLGLLLLLGVFLTAIVGPSSAVVMIPQLDWYEVPRKEVLGAIPYRIYLNQTTKNLWPADITNGIYDSRINCTQNPDNQDCAVAAVGIVKNWVEQHQNQGLQPNLTITQDGAVTRFLTSVGGPPDSSSWTIASTVGYQFARDLGSLWEWMVQSNASLATNISRPLIEPSFVDPSLSVKKPLVQGQCQTYFNPDWEITPFNFPHDQLKTPPLNDFLKETWSLPNEFVKQMIGDNKDVGNVTIEGDSLIRFNWYDTAGNFSKTGAPSLGAVAIFSTTNQHETALAACTFDARWAPVKYYLDPRTDPTIRQDSPNPIDVLRNTENHKLEDLTQMKLHLDWAETLNIQSNSTVDSAASMIESLLERLGNINAYNHWAIYPESGDDQESLAWRISTVLGLVLTEGLARAYRNGGEGSVIYVEAPTQNDTQVRRLDNLNVGNVRGYRDNELDFVVPSDKSWNESVRSWDVWAPANGYTEMKVSVQRYGYGYSFRGTPIKLATTALSVYALLAIGHTTLLLFRGLTFNSWNGMGEMLALAWNSLPTQGLRNTSAGVEKTKTWRQLVKIREGEGKKLQLKLGDEAESGKGMRRKPRTGVEYA